MKHERISVFCGSNDNSGRAYHEAADRLGRILARSGITIVYGGGSTGLMGKLADAALEEGGKVVGVLPGFMDQKEWGHRGLTELRMVDDMHQRKRAMLDASDACVALPGGCGTFEELFEVIAWKSLDLHSNPIVIVNVEGFYDPCVELLERSIAEGFMTPAHRAIWTLVRSPDEVLQALQSLPS